MEHEGLLIVEKAGMAGRFQKLSCIFILGFTYIIYYNTLSIPYQKIRPNALCRPIDDDLAQFVPCDKETYCDPKYEKKIIKETSINNWVVEFNIDCQKESQMELIIMALFIGGFVSFLTFAVWADKFGRKRVLSWEVYGLLTVIVLIMFTNSFYLLCILWFFYEVCNHLMNLLIIYASETMSQSYYTYICMCSNMSFPLAGLVTGLLFSTLRDWRLVHLIFLSLALVYGLIFRIFIIETPPFSLQKGDAKSFLESVQKISYYNQTQGIIKNDLLKFQDIFCSQKRLVKLDDIERRDNLLIPKKTTDHSENHSSFWNIFRNDKDMQYHFFALSFTYSSILLIFYGLLLNIEKFDDNVIFFSVILYISEMTAEFLSGMLAQKYGRIIILRLNCVFIGISFLFFALFKQYFYAKILFCFLGNFAVSAAYNVITIYMPEVFPVSIRSTSVSYCKIPPNFLVIFSPIILSLVPMPFFLFSILGFTSSYALRKAKETVEDK